MDKRILIVGHGAAGRALADDIRRRGGTLVGFVDDGAAGDGVLGTLDQINDVVAEHGVELVYFAIPSAGSKVIRDFINRLDVDRVEFAIIPRTYDVLSRETVHIDDLTDIDVLDLVGREPVKQDVLASRSFVAGKRVLVTGAAGSIGSRLVRLLTGLGAEVACVDWWENGIFFLRQGLEPREGMTFHIADVKNEVLMREILQREKPEMVFHAAAYKHVPLMQENPREAVNNNVWGSLNMMRLSIETGVENFVYVSTDKAVNPVNVMGATKRLGEILLRSLAQDQTGTRFNAVRFGNVIESNGSVMQIFRSQISRKQPLTVTHPDVTRFFMTIDEASQLIVQSAFAGHSGDIFVLDMGEPVRIMDLAQSLVKAVDPSLTIEVVGLRSGEKMYEELSYGPEQVERTENSKIFVVRDASDGDAALIEAIETLIGRSRSYALNADGAVEQLRALGFDIQ